MEVVTEMIMWKGDSCQIMGKGAILCLTGLKAESPAEFTSWNMASKPNKRKRSVTVAKVFRECGG